MSPSRMSWIVLVLVLGMHAVMIANAVLHTPRVGYDAARHVDYYRTLAHGRIPGPKHTYEFHSPPLPYVLPALAMRWGGLNRWEAGKVYQAQNVLCSIGLVILLAGIVRRAGESSSRREPGSPLPLAWTFGLLATLPVYYKTFAFVRGEPMMAFFMVGAVGKALRMRLENDARLRSFVLLGVWSGLAILSREWAWVLVPSFVLWWALGAGKPSLAGIGRASAALAVAVILGGSHAAYLSWTYAGQAHSPVPRADRIALSNLPGEAYTSLGLDRLFTKPIWPAFAGEMLPAFYAETWGDYQGYWILWGVDHRRRNTPLGGANLVRAIHHDASDGLAPTTNRAEAAAYLGRVSAAGIPPTVLYLVAALAGLIALVRHALRLEGGNEAHALLFLVIGGSFAGYFLWLVAYPVPGNTANVKATYMIQTFPFLAVLAADRLAALRRWSPRLHIAAATVLILSALHNLPMLVTRHFFFRYG